MALDTCRSLLNVGFRSHPPEHLFSVIEVEPKIERTNVNDTVRQNVSTYKRLHRKFNEKNAETDLDKQFRA